MITRILFNSIIPLMYFLMNIHYMCYTTLMIYIFIIVIVNLILNKLVTFGDKLVYLIIWMSNILLLYIFVENILVLF